MRIRSKGGCSQNPPSNTTRMRSSALFTRCANQRQHVLQQFVVFLARHHAGA